MVCILLAAYLAVVGALALYGSQRYQMVLLYYKHRKDEAVPAGRFAEADLPRITVQLPVYNEATVVGRLIDSIGSLDYPRDRLEVQVLDDSTDETPSIVRRQAEKWRARGLDIRHLRRADRAGFKAGALQAGMREATGELFAIFDADFLPEPGVLRKTVDFFVDPRVGLVQTRQGHLNAGYSLLTEVEAIALDGHLMIEQTARNRSGRFCNFNGTAGVWRRAAIEDAGGWQDDTLTEDLDLSFRAQLRGWKFVFLPHVVSPGELPADVPAYKGQQRRWTKGVVQCARKLLPSIWRAEIPFKTKIGATFQLTMGTAYVLMVLLCVLMLPVVTVRFERGWLGYVLIDLPFFFAATVSVFFFYAVSQREACPERWWRRLKYIPCLVSVGIGMSLSNAGAVLEGWLGGRNEWIRTPKHGIVGRTGEVRATAGRRGFLPAAELAFGAYFAIGFALAVLHGRFLAAPFLALFLCGFVYIGLRSLD